MLTRIVVLFPQDAKAAEPAKTEFTVKLMSIDDKNKVKAIREVKNLIPSLNLVTVRLRPRGISVC